MVVATNGLGFLVVDARSKIRTDEMIAGILVVALIGLVVFAVGLWVERRTLFWYVEEGD